jgi:hypothetical protein
MILESPEIALAFCGERPQGRMILWISATGTFGHLLRGVGEGKQLGRHLVHPLVRALGGQDHRHQERERIPVVEGDRRARIQRLQRPVDVGRARLPG